MAGVCFQHQPNLLACSQVQRANCARSDVHGEDEAGIYLNVEKCSTQFEGKNGAGQNVAGADGFWWLGGEQNVAGAHGDLHGRTLWRET